MFSTLFESMDVIALHSCLSNFPTSHLHDLRTTCKQFDYISKLIFKDREYECEASNSHSLRYQPCCKHFNRLTSGDSLRFVRLELNNDFATHLRYLQVIQLWNVVSNENLFKSLATALTTNHNLREFYLTSYQFKMGCPEDTSDLVYDALRDHSELRKIMIRPHSNTMAFVESCAKWRSLEFVFIEVATDEDIPQFVKFAAQVSFLLFLSLISSLAPPSFLSLSSSPFSLSPSLNFNRLSNDVNTFFDSLYAPSSLRALAVHANSTSMAHLTTALESMKQLRKLSLGRTFMPTPSDISAFFTAISNLQNLECLNLNWNMGMNLLDLFSVLTTLPRFRQLQIAHDLALVPVPKDLPFEVTSLSSWNLASTDQWVYHNL